MGWIAEHRSLFILLCLAGALVLAAGVVMLLFFLGVFTGGLKVRLVVVQKRAARQVGGTAPDRKGLTIDKLEYALTGVSMAESATLAGSSFSNPQNVLRAELQTTQFDYEAVHYTAAHTDARIQWLDLMDKAAVDRKMASVELRPRAGVVGKNGSMFQPKYTFSFMSVEYLRPIKLKASADLPDGSVMYTRESAEKSKEISLGTSTGAGGESHAVWGVRYDGSFVAEKSEDVTADLATLVMTNSVSWMQLPVPITVTADDLKNSHLALIYDPYLNLRAYARDKSEAAQPNPTGMLADAEGNEWAVPVLTNTPVLVPHGDSVVRDVYVLSPSEKTYDILLVLYYLKNDPAVLRGANTSVVSRGTDPFPADAVTMLPGVMEMKVDGDAWSFLGVTEVAAKERTAFLTDFRRAASGTCVAHAVATSQGTWGIDLGAAAVSVPYVRSVEAEAI